MFISKDCQTKFLADLIEKKTQVHVYLRNGTKLTGTIMASSYDLIFLNGPGLQIVYKDRISTIIPMAEVM